MPKSCLSTDVSGTVPFGRTSGCCVPAPLSVCVVAPKGMFLLHTADSASNRLPLSSDLSVGLGLPSNEVIFKV